MQGKVKWFDKASGIGIVENDQGGEVLLNRVAVANACRVSLWPNEQVEFDIKKGPNGDEATNLHVLT